MTRQAGTNGARVSYGLALVAVVAILFAVLSLGFEIIPAALGVENKQSEIRRLGAGELAAFDSSALEELREKLTEVEGEIEGAIGFARGAGYFSPGLSWLPFARLELAAWGDQGQRLQRNIDAASAMVDSSVSLLDVYSDTQSPLLSIRSAPSTSGLQAMVGDMDTSFADIKETVEKAIRVGRAFGGGVQLLRIGGLIGVVGEIEDRMLTASDVGRRVSALLMELQELANETRPLIDQFVGSGPGSEPWTAETLKIVLADVNQRAITVQKSAGEVVDLVSGAGQLGVLLADLETLEKVLSALKAVVGAGVVTLDVVGPAAGAIEGADGGLLGTGGAMFDVVDAFGERDAEIGRAIVELEEAERTLEGLVSTGEARRFAGELSDMSRLVDELRSSLQLARSIAPTGGSIFGADGVKRYLVLGPSADELRATGGFVSGLWLLTFENGRLADVTYHDSVRVDDWDRLPLYPTAPAGLEEHMNAWVWLLRDISWDPDFPTTARSASDIFRLGKRQDVDGVVAINQWTLLKLIEALDNVPAPGGTETVTPQNLMTVLEEGTDEHGRAYMDLVLQGVFDALNQPIPLPTLVRLGSALLASLESRDTLIFFDDPTLQASMVKSKWDGSVIQSSADYLYVVDSNVGWSKVDRNIERDVHYAVDLSRSGRPRAELTVGYKNHSGPGSPGCVPQWLNRTNDYGHMKNACYWNFLRVYMPQESRVLSSTPLPLPEYSVSVEIGRGVPGQDTGGISSSHNKTVYSGLALLDSGKRAEINLVYDLPSSVLRRDGNRLVYELLLQKQPGVRQRDVVVKLLAPEGYQLAISSLPVIGERGSWVEFSLPLLRDTVLSLEFEPEADGSK